MKREVASVFQAHDASAPILPGKDSIKTEFVYEKETVEEAAKRFEDALRNSKRKEGTLENRQFLGE